MPRQPEPEGLLWRQPWQGATNTWEATGAAQGFRRSSQGGRAGRKRHRSHRPGRILTVGRLKGHLLHQSA